MLRSRIALLILLVPLAVLWWRLCGHAPICGWTGMDSYADGKRFSLSHYDGQWAFVFDMEQRKHWLARERQHAYPPGHWGLSVLTTFLESKEQDNVFRLDLYNHAEERIVRSREIRLPKQSQITIVAGRIIVVETADELRWLNLNAAEPTWQALPIARGDSSWLWSHKKLPMFRRSALKPVPPNSTQPPISYTELFGFDEQGQLHLLATWPTANSGQELLVNAWFQDDAIASLNTSGSHIELRSLQDRSLVKQLELVPPVDLSSQTFKFDYNLLTVQDPSRRRHYYSLVHEKFLKPPPDVDAVDANNALMLSSDGKVALWMGRFDSIASITDPVTDQLVCKIQNPGERYEFLEAGTLISTTPWFGLTIRQHDVKTGATVLTWRPFAWVLPLLALANLSSLIWIGLWLRLRRPSMTWAWSDLHVVLGLLIVLIVVRLRSFGEAEQISRLPYQHAIYLTSGFVFTAWAWMILGNGSIVNRLAHGLIVYAIVLAGLAQALSTNQALAWMGVALVTIPSMLALPFFIAARLRRWNWSIESQTVSNKATREQVEFVTLRQILFVTAICACLSLATRPIASGMGGIFELQWPLWQALCITACGLVAMAMALAQHTWVRRVGKGLAVSVACLFIVEALWLATYCGWWEPWWWRYPEFRHGLGLYCTVFVTMSVLGSVSKGGRPF